MFALEKGAGLRVNTELGGTGTSMVRAIDVFRMPTPVGVMGRSSSITNSFINGIIPARMPSDEEVGEVLRILDISVDDVRCAYCGDKSSEWDHFRPLISGQEPTGHISEIQNLVPVCSKCNQSKGNSHWRSWILGAAKLCPRVRCVSDLEIRIQRLERFENWRSATKLNIPEIVGEDLWNEYRANWRQLVDSMKTSQELAAKLRAKLQGSGGVAVARHHRPSAATLSRGGVSDQGETALLIQRVREWATKPHLNVHRIIGIVVRAGGIVSRDQLVREVARVTKSKNAYGAIASLLTTKGNAYGRVFEDNGGMIRLHPEVEGAIRALKWS